MAAAAVNPVLKLKAAGAAVGVGIIADAGPLGSNKDSSRRIAVTNLSSLLLCQAMGRQQGVEPAVKQQLVNVNIAQACHMR